MLAGKQPEGNQHDPKAEMKPRLAPLRKPRIVCFCCEREGHVWHECRVWKGQMCGEVEKVTGSVLVDTKGPNTKIK